MSETQNTKSSPKSWGLIALMVVFVIAAVYIVKMVLSDDNPHKKSSVTTVTLLKPPPPVTVKEKPPEPEIKQAQKKEELIQTPQDQPKGPENDNTPAGDKLGLDAEGKAGGDAFGLAGKKGGRSLLAGGDGMGRLSLLSKYAGYSKMVETEIQKRVMTRLDEEGGIPKGKLQTVVRISVDSNGIIIDSKIIGSSGNNKMDEAVKTTLMHIKISEPPPEGMPRTIKVKISSQG
jgi:periplasmic protein TonB